MNFAFTAEQDMLRDSVRSYLSDKVPMSRVRELGLRFAAADLFWVATVCFAIFASARACCDARVWEEGSP